MRGKSRNWVTVRIAFVAAMAILHTGCLHSRTNLPSSPDTPKLPERAIETPTVEASLAAPQFDDTPIVQVGHETNAAAALTLPDILDIAAQQHPDLAVARANTEAARGTLIQAGLYPNPIVSPEIDNVNDPRNALGEPGLNIQQEFITGGKRRIDQRAAAQGLSAADWQAMTQWFNVVTKVRQALFELLTAQREERTTKEIERIAESGLAAAQKLLDAGAGNRPDILRAQVEREQAVLKHRTAVQRVRAAHKLLAAAVGVPALPREHVTGNLDQTIPVFDWQSLHKHVLANSSEIREAESKAVQAEELLRRARVQNIPNVFMHIRPSYFVPDDRFLFFARAGVAVPIFGRNQGNIHSAQANLARATAAVGQVQVRLTQRLTIAFRRYEVARQQHELIQNRILKNARESAALVQLGYEKGDPKYDYTALLQAQQMLFQSELAGVQALGELWQAVAEIEGLLQIPVGRQMVH